MAAYRKITELLSASFQPNPTLMAAIDPHIRRATLMNKNSLKF